jgi:two-component system response regulator AtoC
VTHSSTAVPQAPEVTPAIRVLLAEDEPNLGTILEQFLTARGFSVVIVRDGRAALDRLRAEPFDVALLDIMMPELDGLEVLRAVRQDPLPPEVIIITGNGTVETAIEALKTGAYDFLTKPYRMAEIEALVRRAWEKRVLTRDNQHMQSRLRRGDTTPVFVTVYAPMLAVVGLIERVAPSASSVLITGESGTGKDLVARLLHAHADHPNGPFVALDCASLNESMLEHELFGVERGAFPGAAARKLGLLELATGGTLFLDHVDDLDLTVQDKLRRALETGAYCRVGGTQNVIVNARIVAAARCDLTRMVAVGQFREDLLHRLDPIRIALPTLGERPVDIVPLAEHFVTEFGGPNPPRLSDDALAALEQYRWPGNVRELRNVIERAVLLATDDMISARDLPFSVDVDAARATPSTPLTLIDLERQHIQNVLDRTGWHQGRASEFLGISPKTLYRKIREYGFHRPSRFGGVLGGA